MMHLDRKVGETIRIGADIVLTVVGIERREGRAPVARLGLVAPPEVKILRAELCPQSPAEDECRDARD